MENWLFHNFYQMFMIFLLLLLQYIPLERTTRFLGNFFLFLWRLDAPEFTPPPPDTSAIDTKMVEMTSKSLVLLILRISVTIQLILVQFQLKLEHITQKYIEKTKKKCWVKTVDLLRKFLETAFMGRHEPHLGIISKKVQG